MALLGVLIAIPLVVAALMLLLKQDSQRDPVAIAGAGATALAAIATGVLYMNNPQFFVMSPGLSLAGNYVAVAIDLLLCAVVLVYAVRWRNPFAMAIGAVQVVASIWCGSLAMAPEERMRGPHVHRQPVGHHGAHRRHRGQRHLRVRPGLHEGFCPTS